MPVPTCNPILNTSSVLTPTCTFEALVAAVRQCPDDTMAKVHAVNLVSLLAQAPGGRACVALVHAWNFNRYEHFERVLFVLADYGVSLSRHWHTSKPAFFLFAELGEQDPGPAQGAVRVRVVEAAITAEVIEDDPANDWERAA